MTTLDDSVDYIAYIQNLVDTQAGDKIVDSLYEKNNNDLVVFSGMELLSVLALPLQDGTLFERDPFLWEHIETGIGYLVKMCKPKEMLLAFLEQAESIKSDRFFKMLLRYLRTVFIRAPEKRGESLLWALATLVRYVQSVELPDWNPDLTEHQASVLAENSEQDKRLVELVLSCLEFVEPFVSEALHCSLAIKSAESKSHQILSLCTFLLQLLEKPASFFHVRLPENNQFYRNDFRNCVDKLMDLVEQLTSFGIFTLDEWFVKGRLKFDCSLVDDSKSQMTASQMSIGLYCYMVFVENIKVENIPSVYTHEYVLYTVADYCTELMLRKELNYKQKGVLLMDAMQKRCFSPQARKSDGEFGWKLNIFGKSEGIFSSLIYCMNFCQAEYIRKIALQVFDTHIR